jgi:fibronectin-binding autotransporter adhesin
LDFSRKIGRRTWISAPIIVALVFAGALALSGPLCAQTQTPEVAGTTDGGFPPGVGFCGKGHVHCPYQILCVNSNVTDGCTTTISAAIAEISLNKVIIIVGPGTYTDNVSINTRANPLPIGLTRKPLKLTITSSSTAAATIINGDGAGPVFTIGPNAKVQLDGLTITNGAGGPVQEGTGGGGILATGSSLQINSCVISDNQADFGAGIYANSTDLDVENSSIIDNVGQGDQARGGGIYFISPKARKLKIASSTIDGNSASFSGGGILLYGGVPIRSSTQIIDSTISNNTTDNTKSGPGGGAGLDIFFVELTLLNSTISGNNAAGVTDAGGAIRATLSDVKLDNVTAANNSAGESAGGIDNTLTGCIGCGRIKQRFVISNSIIADNNAPANPDCAFGLQPSMISYDYSLVGSLSDCELSIGAARHSFEGDPLLGPLQNNGGATDTQTLLPGSPALGAGNPKRPNEHGRDGRCLTTDQIGTPRPEGNCDIGAYQVPE